VVLEAVQDGEALRYASEALRNDREVVLEAIIHLLEVVLDQIQLSTQLLQLAVDMVFQEAVL
jgi:hypothetical protein